MFEASLRLGLVGPLIEIMRHRSTTVFFGQQTRRLSALIHRTRCCRVMHHVCSVIALFAFANRCNVVRVGGDGASLEFAGALLHDLGVPVDIDRRFRRHVEFVAGMAAGQRAVFQDGEQFRLGLVGQQAFAVIAKRAGRGALDAEFLVGELLQLAKVAVNVVVPVVIGARHGKSSNR